MPFTLAVCAEMVFTDLPLPERVRRIHDRGFACEIWGWTDKDAAVLAATGARFTSMTGYVEGDLTTPDGADALLRTAEPSIAFAREIGCPTLNIHGTGLGEGGLPVRPVDVVTGEMWFAALRTLERVAALAERSGVTYVIENLNTEVDHPGTPFARAADTLALVRAVGSPHLRMNLDLYHAQIGEGNLVELVRRAVPFVGEVQVADVPGRCEPGTGEVAWPFVARALADAGYEGVVAMEAFASDPSVDGSERALDRFRKAFTV
ncbi:TIM barrel protein [Pseudonocardia broussonetiae]|uniref:TIM barrel protein n=1 Tax=Pseudonocardia broussonetiae TaxID=2736640 RepID=A0A6M6JR08_9PSEU|nr:TIM barrel protein [Pseudonocardia broussonetiae]QJY48721.1 TIM barrel protein [Pseudonocardia broussonetiae]